MSIWSKIFPTQPPSTDGRAAPKDDVLGTAAPHGPDAYTLTADSVLGHLISSRTSGAVLLRGGWGSGKTWFVQNALACAAKSRGKGLVVMSVAGLSTQADLDRALLVALYPRLNSRVASVGGAVLKAAARSLQIDLSDLNASSFLDISKVLICVDDLERFQGKTESLFGFLQNLMETHKAMCVVIADEERLASKRTSTFEYAHIKEKVVSLTVELPFDPQELVRTAIEGVQDPVAVEVLLRNAGQILVAFERAGTRNVRALLRAIDAAHRVITALAGTSVRDEVVDLVVIALVVAILHTNQSELSRPHVAAFIGDRDRRIDYYAALGSNAEAEFPNRYDVLRPLEWPASESLGRFILTAQLDGARLVSELLAAEAQSAGEKLLQRVTTDVRSLSEEEFAQGVTLLFAALRSTETRTMRHLLSYVRALLFFAEESMIDMSLPDAMKLTHDHVTALLEHKALIPDSESFDFYLASLREAKVPELLEAADLLDAANDAAMAYTAEAERQRVFEQFCANPQQVIAEYRTKRSSWVTDPIFVDVDMSRLATAMSGWQPSEVADFIRVVGDRRRNTVGDRLAAEEKALQDLAMALEKQLDDDVYSQRPLQSHIVRRLISALRTSGK